MRDSLLQQPKKIKINFQMKQGNLDILSRRQRVGKRKHEHNRFI